MTIHELEHFLSHSSNNPLFSLQVSEHLIPERLEVCEHILEDGKNVELTLDREQGKMILEVYRCGNLVGEPLNFFHRPLVDALLGPDWIQLEPAEIIKRVLDCEAASKGLKKNPFTQERVLNGSIYARLGCDIG